MNGFKQCAPFKPFKTKATDYASRDRDRRRYLHWLFEAKKRFGLSLLDYETSNYVHPSVKPTAADLPAKMSAKQDVPCPAVKQ
jgi:hypothetical protein